MNFSLEELTAANNNGSLESLLLGYGLLPLEVLRFALNEVNEVVGCLESELEIALDSLSSYYED